MKLKDLASQLGLSQTTVSRALNGYPEVSEATRRRAYDVGSNTYEHDVCAGEGWMGIAPLRKALLSKAAGQVLEVAAGTGHNFPLYPPGCKVTAMDCRRHSPLAILGMYNCFCCSEP